jgi:hypothetical protein
MFDEATFNSRHREDVEVAVTDDPVPALIAERSRLYLLADETRTAGNKIEAALPEDVRQRKVRISFSDFSALCDGPFKSEKDLLTSLVAVQNLVADLRKIRGEDADVAVTEFNRRIGLDQALADLRVGLGKIEAAREASGCEAL